MDSSENVSSQEETEATSAVGHELVTFFIPLTVPLNLPNASVYTFVRRDGTVSLKIWRPKQVQPWHTSPLDLAKEVATNVVGSINNIEEQRGSVPKPPSPTISATVIEAVTPVTWQGEESDYHRFSDDFDRCLEEINHLLTAYCIASENLFLNRLSRQTMFPIILFALRQSGEGFHGMTGIFNTVAIPDVAQRITPNDEDLDNETIEQIHVTLQHLKQANPYLNYMESGQKAWRELRVTGDYGAAVIAAHTAGEILFDTTLLMLAWESGIPYSEAFQWFENTGFTSRLRNNFPARLGGSWQPDNTTTVLGRWTMEVTKLRGRILHAGYRPTEQEAYTAVTLVSEVEAFLKDRVIDKRHIYKRTALVLVGKEALEQRGLYNGQLKRFNEGTFVNEESWIESYRRWLQV